MKERITGRYASENIAHPETGEVIVGIGEFIDEDKAEEVVAAGIKIVKIRSAFNCKTRKGICAKCYGRNLATGGAVEKGEAVGTIAAQSIGEPGTQLTMRTFHTGGVAGDDITQGLPRIEELFEARKPKGKGELAPIGGVISIEYGKGKILIKITGDNEITADIQVANTAKMRVANGDIVLKGDLMTDGPLDPHVLLEFKGIKTVQNYILREVQKVYRTQGVDINDKHIEIIIRQMLKKYRVKNSGDTNLLESTMIDIFELEENNEDVDSKAEVNPILLGITQASLATESFLSAASFQETTKVLTDAAIKGKYDRLVGLKENVQIGKLIPTGTGFVKYNLLEVKKIGNQVDIPVDKLLEDPIIEAE